MTYPTWISIDSYIHQVNESTKKQARFYPKVSKNDRSKKYPKYCGSRKADGDRSQTWKIVPLFIRISKK